MEEEFDKADQIATLPAPMAVKQVPAGIDIEGGARIPVQGTEPYKLLPGAAPAGSPVMPQQIVQQREVLFELFQVRVHGVVSSGIESTSKRTVFPGKDGGQKRFLRGAVARAVAGTEPWWARITAKHCDESFHRVPATGPPQSLFCAETKTKAVSNPGSETSVGE